MPGRWSLPDAYGRSAPFAVRAGAAAALFTAAVLLRLALRDPAYAIAPFALLFPAMLAATLLAGWPVGVIGAVVSGLASWALLLAPQVQGALLTPGAVVALVLYGASSAAVIAVAEAYRRSSQALSAGRRALEESDNRFRLAAEASQAGVWEWRIPSNEMIYSDLAKQICGFRVDQPVTYDMVAALTHPDDRDRIRAQAARALDPARRENARYEYRIVRPDGEVRWVTASGEAVFETVDGKVRATRYVGTLVDITERKQAEDRLLLLAREVDHRANNLMSVVQSLVGLSRGADLDELRKVISGRVQALARAHQLLSAARWAGADLRRLVEEELLAFSLDDGARVIIAGEDVSLSPAAAQSIAMAIHELTTNAAKYGALSIPTGQVTVRWTVEESRLLIRWTESGGPPVVRPRRSGFGASLIQRALGGAAQGEVRLDWRPEGLVCELELPLEPPLPQPVEAVAD